MEASAAGLASAASGEGESQQQGQEGQGQQQEQQTPEASMQQLTEGLQGTQQSLEEMRAFLQSNPWAPPPAEEQPQAPDLAFLEEPGITQEQAAERLAAVMDERASQKANELLAPMQKQLSEMQSQQGADALVSEFPELGKPEVAEAVVKHAEQQAEIMGQPELASNFGFIKMTYMAGRASQLAQAQQGAGASDAATLEGAGGASPGGATQGDTQAAAEAIGQKWAERKSVLPKW